MEKELEFKAGDIIEILNLSQCQIEDILSQTNYTRSVADLKTAIIGSRYKVKEVAEAGRMHNFHCVCLDGWNQGGHISEYFAFSQVRLYHRENQGVGKWTSIEDLKRWVGVID